jgi:hypothetical protein
LATALHLVSTATEDMTMTHKIIITTADALQSLEVLKVLADAEAEGTLDFSFNTQTTDADLDICTACGRESLSCSIDPCDAVIADRGEEEIWAVMQVELHEYNPDPDSFQWATTFKTRQSAIDAVTEHWNDFLNKNNCVSDNAEIEDDSSDRYPNADVEMSATDEDAAVTFVEWRVSKIAVPEEVDDSGMLRRTK